MLLLLRLQLYCRQKEKEKEKLLRCSRAGKEGLKCTRTPLKDAKRVRARSLFERRQRRGLHAERSTKSKAVGKSGAKRGRGGNTILYEYTLECGKDISYT